MAEVNVTGFSNEEEKLAALDKFVPFLPESELVSRGASYKKADQPWAPLLLKTQGSSLDKIQHPAVPLPIY